MNQNIHEFIHFVNASPTAWHAVDWIKQKLQSAGFLELKEKEKWKLEHDKGYFVIRNGSSICAFIVPSTVPQSALLIASHTDSPGFKLKPNAEFRKENMVMLGVEVYGSPLLTSWLNRDLGIAGRIVYTDNADQIKESLICLNEHPVIIPQLAIHLDRNVNESGPLLNKQEHLSALAALEAQSDQKSSYLEKLIKKEISFRSLLCSELFLYPLEKASFLGYQQQMIAAYRIDSLGSVHAAIRALLDCKNGDQSKLKMVVLWDNEEVGSETAHGAGSPFASQVMERIGLALNASREDYLRFLSQSLCVSVDLAHALHPNYSEKHDPRHQILMNKGIVIKYNAQQRYATNAHSASFIAYLCKKHGIPFQEFVSRGDIPCGTTIGPIHASLTGIPTVDIGSAQLSMHSCREICSCQDHLDMCKLLREVFS